jgi:hypothetical protein
VLADVEDGDDVRVRERSRDARFTEKARRRLLFFGLSSALDDLDRDFAV